MSSKKETSNFRLGQFIWTTILAALLSAPLATLLSKLVEDWWQSDQHVLRNAIVIIHDSSDPDHPNSWFAYIVLQNAGSSSLNNISINDENISSRILQFSWHFPSNGASLYDREIQTLKTPELCILRADLSDSVSTFNVSANTSINLERFESKAVYRILDQYGLPMKAKYNSNVVYLSKPAAR